MNGESIAIVIFSGRSLGGLERRFARLAAHLIETRNNVRLYCTADTYQGCIDIGIRIPDRNCANEESAFLIDRASRGNYLHDKLNRVGGIIRLIFALTKHSGHIHLAMNPGLVSTVLSLVNVHYSISIVDYKLDFKYWFLKRTIAKAKSIDCLSEAIREKLITKCRDLLVPNCSVSPCSFTDVTAVSETVDGASQVERDLDVSLIARRVPGKGHDLFNQALDGLSGVTYYMEPTNDPFGIMRRSKIFLSLQETENYPSQALLEAMVSGCAIIATDVGETRKLLDESCAVLIPYDASILTESIYYLLKNSLLREQMAENARKRVLADHTIERYTAYFLDLCSEENEMSL